MSSSYILLEGQAGRQAGRQADRQAAAGIENLIWIRFCWYTLYYIMHGIIRIKSFLSEMEYFKKVVLFRYRFFLQIYFKIKINVQMKDTFKYRKGVCSQLN